MSAPVLIEVTDSGAVLINGSRIEVPDGTDPRTAAVRTVAARFARTQGSPVQAIATEPTGRTRITIHPDGSARDARPIIDEPATDEPAATEPDESALPPIEPAPATTSTAPVDADTSTAARRESPLLADTSARQHPLIASVPQDVQSPAPAREAQPRTRAEARSFLASSTTDAPQPTGWRKFLNGMGIGTKRTQQEQQVWHDTRAISQHWPGPRTIAVVNGKGGAGKTPATAILSALFARNGGSGVLAWDCNVTRGTLGWRTEQGTHDATVLDLLDHTERLLTPQAQAADLAAFVHHQIEDKFDVLRSNPLLLSTEQKLTLDELDAVHAVASKYFRLTIMDTGNDEGDALWLRAIEHADALVVPTNTRADCAEAARLLLEALRERDEHSARLADNAVVIVSQADAQGERAASDVADGFRDLARSVVAVPYDPALREQWLRLDNLAATTQHAYLRAAAEVAAGL